MNLTTFQIKNKTIAKGIGWNTEINESVFRPNTLSNFKNQILFRPVYSTLDLGFNVTWDWLLHAVEWLEVYGGFSIKIQDLRVESKTINSAEFYDFVEKSDGFYNKFDITYEAVYRICRWLENNEKKKEGERFPYNRNKQGFHNLERSANDYRDFILTEHTKLEDIENIKEFATIEFKSKFIGIGEYTLDSKNTYNFEIIPGQWLCEFNIQKQKGKIAGIDRDIITVANLIMVNSGFKDQDLIVQFNRNLKVDKILAMSNWGSFGKDEIFTEVTSFEEGPDNLIWLKELSTNTEPYKVLKNSVIAVHYIWGLTIPTYTCVDPKTGSIVKIIMNFNNV